MEWDADTIWKISLGIFFVLCGAGGAYALFRLGDTLKQMSSILSSVDSEMLPLLTRVETTLDEVNGELSKSRQDHWVDRRDPEGGRKDDDSPAQSVRRAASQAG